MENSKKPAFPKNRISYFDKNINEQVDIPSYSGLTKREYFAAMAMQGLISCNAIYGGKTGHRDALCKDAILHADELLKQLEQ